MDKYLVSIEGLTALELYSDQNKITDLISKIKEQVKCEVVDASTEAGRKRIGSLARKIGSAKSRLEEMGMELTEEWRTKTKTVNDRKKLIKTELDALRDEIRKPLDDFLNAEKERIKEREDALDYIQTLAEWSEDLTLDEWRGRVEDLKKHVKNIDWMEFESRARSLYSSTMTQIKRHMEAVEIETKRKAEEEQERKHRAYIEKIKRDEGIRQKAIEQERLRADAERKRQKDIIAKRMADEEHKLAIQNQILEDCEKLELWADVAFNPDDSIEEKVMNMVYCIVQATAAGKIRHLKVMY